MVLVRASLRGFREHPRSGVLLSVLAVLVTLILFRTRPPVDPRTFGLTALLIAGPCLFLPAAIHEAHGRWQLRPTCREGKGQWSLEISPRWADPASCRCEVADRSGRSWYHEFGQLAGRTVVAFPLEFERLDDTDAGTAPPRGRHLVRWTVRQAGNTFEASAEFMRR